MGTVSGWTALSGKLHRHVMSRLSREFSGVKDSYVLRERGRRAFLVSTRSSWPWPWVGVAHGEMSGLRHAEAAL